MALQRGEETFEVTLKPTQKNEEAITAESWGKSTLSWVNSKSKYLEAKTMQTK